MKATQIRLNRSFVGRHYELARLRAIGNSGEAAIVAVYGRRRIGKTELLEQAFRDRNILKFEGIEGQSEERQRQHVMLQLADYVEDPLIARINVTSWLEVFKIIARYIEHGVWTLYFEEVQWLANYSDDFISELKYVWDNYFRHNDQLLVVLCGSAPSFIINHVLKSNALYNRSLHSLVLREFSVLETKEFLGKRSDREIMDGYLTVGGIPEYLKWLKSDSSVFLSLCQNTFITDGFFAHEYTRIFVSSMAKTPHYQAIISYLSRRRFATRDEIARHLKLTGGGTLSAILQDLELCGFIAKYTPYNLGSSSKLARYAIGDSYLRFYFKFVGSISKEIDRGIYNNSPTVAINTDTYFKWLGFSFEHFCRSSSHLFAKILGFSGIKYTSGAFFNRSTIRDVPGYQIDLIYDRADQTYTICEIKYLQRKVGVNVISEFERKLSLFPNPDNRAIQKVLITSIGADDSLIARGYFDAIINLRDIFLTIPK